jgi:aldose 1-epimerase
MVGNLKDAGNAPRPWTRGTSSIATLGGGRELLTATINNGRLRATVLNAGASIMDLSIAMPGGLRPLILTYADPLEYVSNIGYLGAIVGRCANRIKGGQFTLDGDEHQLDRNENGRTHLHGGAGGFGQRLWEIEEVGETQITLSINSVDGDQGYPGNVRARCIYALLPENRFRISLSATTDANTLVNLTTHCYFNLEQPKSILDHTLAINASSYLPFDSDLIPTGQIAQTTDTDFDFRHEKPIGQRRNSAGQLFDHNFALDVKTNVPAAVLRSPSKDLSMSIFTTEPGIQFYEGRKIATMSGLRGFTQSAHAGCCLEPQHFPDAINHQHFAQPILRPGETYEHVSELRFETPFD